MALDLLINIPVGIIGAIATLMLMPNYTMQTRRFDLSGFLLLAVGMAVLTLALDGSKGAGLSPLAIAGGRSWRGSTGALSAARPK
ncbi:hypothetical protein DMI62_14970 [Escherichia coli]|nr:hypothetical protein [Escherichia coli]